VNTDWSFLSYHLATRGIPCDIEETETDDYEFDPWRPTPNTEAVTVTLTKDDAALLASLVSLSDDEGGPDYRRYRLENQNPDDYEFDPDAALLAPMVSLEEFDRLAREWARENRYFKIGKSNTTFDEFARKRGYVPKAQTRLRRFWRHLTLYVGHLRRGVVPRQWPPRLVEPWPPPPPDEVSQ
jgi:hypothetical protein